MEALQAEQNLVATAAATATVVRVLVPMAGRFVCYLWNKATGEVKKEDDAEELIMPTEIIEALEQQQQQQQESPQQQQAKTPETPSGSGKRNRISPIYSKEPNPKGNLLEDFNKSKKEGTTITTGATTYQFGPKMKTIDADDYNNTLKIQQDIDTAKIRSVQYGKGENNGQTRANRPQVRTCGLDDDSQLDSRTVNARFRMLEDEIAQLRKEKANWQQQHQLHISSMHPACMTDMQGYIEMSNTHQPNAKKTQNRTNNKHKQTHMQIHIYIYIYIYISATVTCTAWRFGGPGC